jgi:PilZ domain
MPQTGRSVATAEGSARAPERRRNGRSRIAHAVTVVINETNAALMANLGQGGMRVRALGRPLEPGTNLRLQFQLPGLQELIHTSGAVAWVNNTAEAGIRFAGLSAPLARQLREWVARNGVANAAQELVGVAGGWQPALDMVAQLARMLTGACGVAIILSGERLLYPAEGGDLPARATVAAPIYEGQRIIGHLEISSPQLGAFDEQDLGALPVLASLIGEMVDLRAAQLRQPKRKVSALPARIVSRIGGMFPTVRVRLVP